MVSTNALATTVSAEMVLPQTGFYIFKVARGTYTDNCQFELLVQAAE